MNPREEELSRLWLTCRTPAPCWTPSHIFGEPHFQVNPNSDETIPCANWYVLRQDGTVEHDALYAVAVDEGDGSMVFAGQSEGSWSGDNAGNSDLVAMKLDANGDLQWTWQVTHEAVGVEDRMPTMDARVLYHLGVSPGLG